jgi:glycosyltransferase involved in cell wall biosynthesis
MMRELGRLGHDVALLTQDTPSARAVDGLKLNFCTTLPRTGQGLDLTMWQERFLSYWGIDAASFPVVGLRAAEWGADAVIAVGLDMLPCLAGVNGPQRIWYAADEAAWHHLSQVRPFEPASWDRVKAAIINALYERAFASYLDRIWVVSETDRRAMRWASGVRAVDVIPNGVDGDYYQPFDAPEEPYSCIFWGRLDFGPNVQALAWFCQRIWPRLCERMPDARFSICGRCPVPAVWALADAPGITLLPDVIDLRPEIARHQVVVLPFVSGGGIKNKLLEAASLGKAMVCSPRACNGLEGAAPLVVARSMRQWVDEVCALWRESERRKRLGRRAREWVQTTHTWDAAARKALMGLGAAAIPIQETFPNDGLAIDNHPCASHA